MCSLCLLGVFVITFIKQSFKTIMLCVSSSCNTCTCILLPIIYIRAWFVSTITTTTTTNNNNTCHIVIYTHTLLEWDVASEMRMALMTAALSGIKNRVVREGSKSVNDLIIANVYKILKSVISRVVGRQRHTRLFSSVLNWPLRALLAIVHSPSKRTKIGQRQENNHCSSTVSSVLCWWSEITKTESSSSQETLRDRRTVPPGGCSWTVAR